MVKFVKMKVYLLVHIHKKVEAYRILLYTYNIMRFPNIMINAYITLSIASLIFVWENDKVCKIDIEKFSVLYHRHPEVQKVIEKITYT